MFRYKADFDRRITAEKAVRIADLFQVALHFLYGWQRSVNVNVKGKGGIMPRTRKTRTARASVEPFWKIGLYIRLSREDDNEDDSESIINQEKILRDFVGSTASASPARAASITGMGRSARLL